MVIVTVILIGLNIITVIIILVIIIIVITSIISLIFTSAFININVKCSQFLLELSVTF
jgi:hypothetical protein